MTRARKDSVRSRGATLQAISEALSAANASIGGHEIMKQSPAFANKAVSRQPHATSVKGSQVEIGYVLLMHCCYRSVSARSALIYPSALSSNLRHSLVNHGNHYFERSMRRPEF